MTHHLAANPPHPTEDFTWWWTNSEQRLFDGIRSGRFAAETRNEHTIASNTTTKTEFRFASVDDAHAALTWMRSSPDEGVYDIGADRLEHALRHHGLHRAPQPSEAARERARRLREGRDR